MALTDEQLAEIEQRAKRAHTELGDVCANGVVNRWRMSIPANPHRDSDLIISAGLEDVETLLAEVKRLRRELTKMDRHTSRVRTELASHRKIAGEHIEERDRLRGEWEQAEAERDRLHVDLATAHADLNDAERQRCEIEEQRHRLAERIDDAEARLLQLFVGADASGTDLNSMTAVQLTAFVMHAFAVDGTS